MRRRVEPELLDSLPADDPRAAQSRRDLRRVNWWMGNVRIVSRSLIRVLGQNRTPKQIVELGAGDGTFALRLAKRMVACWPEAKVLLVDRQSLLTPQTRAGFAALKWTVASVQADIFEWLEQSAPGPNDLMLANLFLHHFPESSLARLFEQCARRTDLFVACEPRRWKWGALSTRLLWLIGCNGVTRHDAIVSVRAGFAAGELSRLWPKDRWWELEEGPAGFASHYFTARRVANAGALKR